MEHKIVSRTLKPTTIPFYNITILWTSLKYYWTMLKLNSKNTKIKEWEMVRCDPVYYVHAILKPLQWQGQWPGLIYDKHIVQLLFT